MTASIQASTLSLSITAYDTVAQFALRPQLIYDALATVQPDTTTNPGKTVSWDFIADLPAITSPVSETSDVTLVGTSDSQVTLTLNEYANAIQTTAVARAFDYIPLNPIVANVLGFNAGYSLDSIARNAVQAGTNVIYSGAPTHTTRATTAVTDTFKGLNAMNAVAQLRTNNVMPWSDGLFRGVIHPTVSVDLRTTTGAGGWNDVHVYSGPAGIFNGVIGTLGGVQWIESSRAPEFAGAGASGANVYGTLIMGQQAIVKSSTNAAGYTNGNMPTFGSVPVVDVAERFTGLYWKWCGAYGVFRQAALYRIESGASIG